EVPTNWQRFQSKKCAVHPAVGDQVIGDSFGGADRDGESDARGGSRRSINRGVYADHFTVRVDERASGIAAIDSRVGLNGFIDESRLTGLHRAAQRADHAGGQGTLKSERIADGQYFLPHLQIV